MLTDLGDVQIPLLAAMLLGGCAGKVARAVRQRSVQAGLGPTTLFPLRLRGWAAGALCAAELLLGVGLIVTCGRLLSGPPAELVRLGSGLLFVVATCALIEIRGIRPSASCGCFGDLSTSPITGRTLARPALLAVAALAIIRLRPIELPGTPAAAAVLLLLFAAEVGLLGALSPEVREVLVRIGYSAPCELRAQAPEVTIARLRRTAQWRRHAHLIADDRPADVWRELCWRYVAYASRHATRDAVLVFAVYLDGRRPPVKSALVDSATGAVLPWPAGAARPARLRLPAWPRAWRTRPMPPRHPGRTPARRPTGRPARRPARPSVRPLAHALARPAGWWRSGANPGRAAALPLSRAGRAGSDRSAGP